MINVHIDEPSQRVIIALGEAPKRYQLATRRAFYLLGVALRHTAQQSIMEKPKHGRLYLIRQGKRLKRHRASAPGESPANLSGKLKRGIGFNVRGYDRLEFGVRETVKYGKFLEKGTKKMAARPYLISAIKKNEKTAIEYFGNEINKAMNESGIRS